MIGNFVYFGLEIEGRLISLASAEINLILSNVKMTVFATLPEFRSNSFARWLLGYMENVMRSCGLQISYTIARSVSIRMNITFGKTGYIYAGRSKA